MVIDNNDISIYNDILDKIISLAESNSNTKKIHITSHQKYSEQDQSEISSALKNKFNIINFTNFYILSYFLLNKILMIILYNF